MGTDRDHTIDASLAVLDLRLGLRRRLAEQAGDLASGDRS